MNRLGNSAATSQLYTARFWTPLVLWRFVVSTLLVVVIFRTTPEKALRAGVSSESDQSLPESVE